MEKRTPDFPPMFNPYCSDANQMYGGCNFESEPMMNPKTQYEQMYMYYKYLTQQMEYKLRVMEFENISRMSEAENKKA